MQLLPTALVYFLEVARTGSISEAATRLTVAPSAISRQIAKLESEIGVPLFARHPRGMSLTDSGTRLLAHTRRSEAESATLVDDLRARRTLRTRTITVAATEGFSHALLPGAMAAFRQEHPDVAFRLDIVANEEATRRVVAGEADIALTYTTRLQQHGVQVEGAAVVPVYAIVPLGHELADKEQMDLAELCQFPLALPARGTLRELFDLAVEVENITCRPVLICNGLAPKYEFVRKGGGLALVGGAGGVGSPRNGVAEGGVAYVGVDHAVFRKREVQVQTMPGRMLPLPTMRFTELLVSLIPTPQPHRD